MKIVIYPAYFDMDRSKREGRRVPKSLAWKNPSLEEVRDACEKLSLDPVVEEKSYPKCWWVKGRVLVDKKDSKGKLLRMIAEKVKEIGNA